MSCAIACRADSAFQAVFETRCSIQRRSGSYPSNSSPQNEMVSCRSVPRRYRRASAIGSNGISRPTPCPSTNAAAKFVLPINDAGRQPTSSTRPTADIRRIEKVLAQPSGPVGQHQCARRRVEHFPGSRGSDGEFDGRLHPRTQVRGRKERLRAEHGRDSPADIEVMWPQAVSKRLDCRSVRSLPP